MKCLVKDLGKQCHREAINRGQCSLHQAYWRRQIKKGLMTWEFLIQSGEALPLKAGKIARQEKRNAQKNNRGEVPQTKKATSKTGKGKRPANRKKKPNRRVSKK
jgi:hypothetical protein